MPNAPNPAQPWEPMALECDEDIVNVFRNGARPYITSAASQELLREVRRFASRRTILSQPTPRTRPRTFGRSVLISGIRGSGKTGTVYWVLRQMQAELLKEQYPLRLLPVLISASAFLEDDSEPTKEVASSEKATLTNSTNSQAHDAALVTSTQLTAKEYSKVSTSSITSSVAGSEERRTKLVSQLCIGLYRVVIREFLRGIRERIRKRAEESGASKYRSLDDCELLAQFSQDLQDHLAPADLRAYWRRFDFLRPDEKGAALFPSSPSLPIHQGIEEINLLQSLNDVYLRAVGTLDRTDATVTPSKPAADAEKVPRSLTDPETWKPLISALVGGSIAGTGAASTAALSGAPTIVLFSILGATGVGWLSTLFSSWTRKHPVIRQEKYTKDYTRNTLHHEIPRIVDALFLVGLCPVFVIDELDKIQNLLSKVDGLLKQLKQFFQEDGFFCFLTNREFFDDVAGRIQTDPFSPLSTYFTNRVFIEFAPWDVRAFVRDSLRELF